MKKKNKGGLLFLMSVVFGGFLGGFVGMFKDAAESHAIILDVKVLIPWISTICLLIGFISILLTFNFLKKSRTFHSLYQEEMDDDLNESYYVQMYRNLEFGSIAFNITNVAILLALFISASEMVVLNGSQANLEQSFRILFQLHQYVLPTLYFLIALFSLLTGEIQLLAFVLVGAIHVYINVMQLPMVKRYFK